MSPRGGPRIASGSGFPLLLVAVLPGLAPAQAPGAAGPADSLRRAVEESVTPGVVAAGRPLPRHRLADRMAVYRVPGVSVAVLDAGEIAWAGGYGVADVETGEPVTPSTLFQAASISKPVAAVAALRLVEEGVLDLDGPVDGGLRSWTLPDADAGSARDVTLRRILTHTAGLTVHGFPGYGRGEELPSVPEILDGEPPANTEAVRLFTEPGSEFSYSGGGYTVLQQLLVDATGEAFPALLRRLVLGPAGMEASTYAQPLPEARWEEAAAGHLADGERVDGGWHVYPEMAAAGLWTTPADLLRLAREIQRAAGGEEGRILSPSMARRMTRRVSGEMGLGFAIEGEGRERRFTHGGSNRGFKAYFAAFAEGGRGAVVMTNGDQGSALAREVLLGIARVHGWPGPGPERVEVASPSPGVLEALAGEYVFGDPLGATVRVTAAGGRLRLRWPGRGMRTLLPTSDTTFVLQEEGWEVAFETDPGGGPEAMVVGGRLRGERKR